MIDAAETEATTGDSTNSIDGKNCPRQTKSLRCWSYKARLALVEKGERNHVDPAQLKGFCLAWKENLKLSPAVR